MAKTKTSRARATPKPSRQAPTGAWSPDTLLKVLKSGSRGDKMAAARAAGIIDSKGKLTGKYRNWGSKVSRTPDSEGAAADGA